MAKVPKLTTMYNVLSFKDVVSEGFNNCEFFKTMENSNVKIIQEVKSMLVPTRRLANQKYIGPKIIRRPIPTYIVIINRMTKIQMLVKVMLAKLRFCESPPKCS